MNDELNKLSVSCDVYHNPIYTYWANPSSHKGFFSTILKYTFFFIGLLKIFFKINSYNVLNPHGVILSGFSATIIKYIVKIPVVLYIHGGDLNLYPFSSKLYRKVYDFTIRNSNIVIVNSQDIKKKLLLYTQINTDKIHVISPGINLEHFFPLSKDEINVFKQKYHISEDKIVLLFVGNAIERKGLDIFVDALFLLNLEQQKKIEVVFCTEGNELKGIKSRINTSPTLCKATKYFGKVEQSILNIFYNMTTIFIFPSREEPLGLVGLEAIASGTPVIGANTGGIPEYINDDNGLLFEPNNPQSLADILKKLINDPQQLKKLTSNLGSEHAQHSIHQSAKSIKFLFEKFSN